MSRTPNPCVQHLISTNTVEIAELGALALNGTMLSRSYFNTMTISHKELRGLCEQAN